MHALLVALALMQAPETPPAIGVEQSVQLALADLQSLPPAQRPHTRYLWIGLNWGDSPRATEPAWVAVTRACNVGLSRSPFGVTPVDFAGGRMIRLDLSQMAISDTQAANLYATYDGLAELDRVYHFARLTETDKVFTDAKGRKWSGRWETVVHPRLAAGYAELVTQTNSPAPLLLAEWAAVKMLTSIDGGRYYHFRGLKDRNGKPTMKLDEYLRSRGADRAAAGSFGSDERAALIKSGVTGKPRRIDVFRGGGVRPSVGTGLVSITHDISDGQTKVANDPIKNLLAFESAASEVILEVANGEHEFTLWNAQGELQDEVPATGDGAIAVDTTAPKGAVPRLQSALSCIRCHGPHEGWQPFENDVQRLADGDLSLIADLGAGQKAFEPTTLNRLLGLYGGNLAEPLRLGRNTLFDVTYRTTGGYDVPRSSEALALVYQAYHYPPELVKAADALALLGVPVPAGVEPAKVLQAAVPPTQGVEDPLMKALHAGVGIQRWQFELLWPSLIDRLQRN
jgi:hypothetical protein